MNTGSYVRPLQTLSMDDVREVGGKNAALGLLIQDLKQEGIRVPDGFATTAQAYRDLCEHYGDEAVDVAVRSSATAEGLPEARTACRSM